MITKEELEELAMRVRDLRDRVERACRERIDAMAVLKRQGGHRITAMR